jgi:hypothetical protein
VQVHAARHPRVQADAGVGIIDVIDVIDVGGGLGRTPRWGISPGWRQRRVEGHARRLLSVLSCRQWCPRCGR